MNLRNLGVYRIFCECGLLYINEIGRNLPYILKTTRRIARKAIWVNQLCLRTYNHRINWDEAIFLATVS